MEWEDFDLPYIFVSVSGTVRMKKGYMVKLDEKLPLAVAEKRKITCNIYSNRIQAVKGRTEDGEEMTLKVAKVNSVRGWRKVMDKLAKTDDPIRMWASSSGREEEMPTMMRGIIDWADENPRKSIVLYMTPEESDKKLMMSEASVFYEDVSDKEVDETKKTLRDWVYKGDPGKYKINMHKRGKAKEVPGYDPFQMPCAGPVYKTEKDSYHAPCITEYCGEVHHKPNMEHLDIPWYDATKEQRRIIKMAPSAEDLYKMKGVSGSFKEGCVAKGYDFYLEECRKRDRSVERKHKEDQESVNFELEENSRKDKALRCQDPGIQYDNADLNWEPEPELIRMTSRRVPTPWIPELRNPRLNSWEQSMIGGCEEEESTVPVAGLSLQDIIPQRESGESTECFLTRCVEAGVGTQLLDLPGGKAILRSRGAVIPKSVKPSDIVYNQGGTPGEDNMDAVVTKLINQVRKGELGLQLAMRSQRSKMECRELHEERLIQGVPGGRELSAKWKFLTVGEKAQALLIHDRRGVIDKK